MTNKILFDTNILASESKPSTAKISYEVFDATATISEDYNIGSLTSRSGIVPVEFESNGTNYDAFITLNIIDDDIHEDNETFKLILRNPQEVVFPLPTPPSQESDIIRKIEIPVTIASDNDNELTLMNPITTSQVNENDGLTSIDISLNHSTSVPVSVKYSTSIESTNSATQDDFIAQTDQILTINDGTTGRIDVPIINDSIDEENETFTVTITEIASSLSGVTPTTLNHKITVTIMDDETAPTLTVCDPPQLVSVKKPTK